MNGGIVTTLTADCVSDPANCISSPHGVLFGENMNRLYVLSFDCSDCILSVDPDTGAVTPLWIGPPFSFLLDITFDANHNLYLTDCGTQQVFKFDPGDPLTPPELVAGNGDYGYSGDGGPATAASLACPIGAAIDPSDGSVWIADTDNLVIRRVDTGGTIHTVAGNGNIGNHSGPALEYLFVFPLRPRFDEAGNLYVSDNFNERLRAVVEHASLVITPDLLNANSKGKWVTIMLEPSVHTASAIDVNSIRLALLDDQDNFRVSPFELNSTYPVVLGDSNGNGIPDLTGKLLRSTLQPLIENQDTFSIEAWGKFTDNQLRAGRWILRTVGSANELHGAPVGIQKIQENRKKSENAETSEKEKTYE